MEKEIIVLAMSEKYGNYCIAGIDISTGKWIRPMSERKDLFGAVPLDIKYNNGKKPKILDIAKINFIRYEPNRTQTENYVYDSSQRWIKKGTFSKNDLPKYINRNKYIFFNDDKKLEPKDILNIPKIKRYSLTLVKPLTIDINIKTFEQKNITISFNYNNINYEYIKVTDPIFKNEYLSHDDGWETLSNCFLVLSLGEEWKGYLWKMVATIIKP
jgi:hypothetical protein